MTVQYRVTSPARNASGQYICNDLSAITRGAADADKAHILASAGSTPVPAIKSRPKDPIVQRQTGRVASTRIPKDMEQRSEK